jgi:hypothetical protein
MPDQGTCRSCGAEILWVTMSPSGKKNPLNLAPDLERGNVFEAPDGTWATLGGEDLKVARMEGLCTYLSHFVTCPSANQHKKPKAS